MTTRKSRPVFVTGVMLLLAAAVLFLSFSQPVWADDEEELTPKKAVLTSESDSPDEEKESGESVHKDINTFKKNFVLTAAQKQYTITECEKVISKIITPDMSDLEKYYRIAVWVNDRVEYDWKFWGGEYDFDYYSHQWDAYGGMKEDEKSVCVGIAIFYANMCHAADLPCRFVRLNPDYLDHTISYIPDINGHAYYADVTENDFLMSDESGSSFTENVDKDFAKITKDADDHSFDYTEYGELKPPALKDENGVYASYDDWFNEFALHDDTTKTFETDYVEKGSGLRRTEPGSYHASYTDFPSNFTDSPKCWFLEDFYEDPEGIRQKIENGQFDEQLIIVSGLKKNYDCSSVADLEEAVAEDIAVEYFPSVNESGDVVPVSAELTKGTDYEVKIVKYNDATNTAEFTINAMGSYQGSQTLQVVMNSAVVTKAPVGVKGLVFDGNEQALVEAGKAKIGEMPTRMEYGIGTKTRQPEVFSPAIPIVTDAGKYYIWYRAAGDKDHASSQPQRLERPVTIKPMQVNIVSGSKTVAVGKAVTLSPKLEVKKLSATFTFESDDPSIATVNSKGTVKGIKPGDCLITVHAKLEDQDNNYKIDPGTIYVKVVKAANPLKISARSAAVSYSKLKKKAQTLGVTKIIRFTKKLNDKKTYTLVSAKKGSRSFRKYFGISKTTGKLTVKKGLKKGTYKVKVKVRAAGNKSYKPSAVKSVTCTVKVR